MTKYTLDLEKRLQKKIDKIESDKSLSDRNKEIVLRYLRESALGKTIRKGQKREIGAGRNLQVAGILLMMCKDWFNKDLDKVNQGEMEKFILELNNNKIMTSDSRKKQRPYSPQTKSNIKKLIRKFYKWLLGENKYYPELVEWIDTSKKDSIVQAIEDLDKGVYKIVELIPEIRRKALVWVTFDSGFRTGEIIPCKIKDLEKREDGYFYITCRVSKTKPRTVSLPLSSKLLERWLDQHPDKDNPESNLFQTSRVMFYKTMKLYSNKALGKDYSPHILRHTSATYWAKKLDRVSLCKRFGWSYSSDTPDRYIDFAKVTQDNIIDLIEVDKIGQIKQENQELKDELRTIKKYMLKYDNLLSEIYDNPNKKAVFRALLES